MNELLTSMIHRPYVFAFLLSFLFLGWRFFGWRRTLVWLTVGYGIAWLSEISSITNGFPYGEYHYVYESMPGELMVLGVPFFDSLSYAFLTFASFSTAVFILGRKHANGTAASVLLGALLTMLLDVMVDPPSTMGEKWFLGRIHYYAHPGWYFGVPLTNFGGWFITALAIIAANAGIWKIFPRLLNQKADALTHHRMDVLFPAFYCGIAGFIIAITFWIGEWKLGIVSMTIMLCIAGLCLRAFAHARRQVPLDPEERS
jgi:putative membrane protein